MTLDWKRKRLDNLVVLFNNQSLSMSKDSSNNILSFKFSPDEVCRTINLNSTVMVNLSNKRDLSLCNREIKMPIGINISFKAKSFGQMFEGFKEAVFEYPSESCAVFFLSKTPVRLLVMVILKESLISSFKGVKGWAIISS